MTNSLSFRADGTFKIVQLTDLHIDRDTDHPRDQKTYEAIRHVIEYEKPDLLAVTGDLIWSDRVDPEVPDASYRRIVDYIASFQIPFAIVYGNHDSEAYISREGLMRINHEYEHSLAISGPDEIHGVGNYTLEIKGNQTDANKHILYFLDSGDYSPENLGHYEWIHPDQVNWFREETKKNPELPGIALFHIPLPEFKEAIEKGQMTGNKFEPICSPVVNSGMFTAMLEAENIMGAFVGHDHDNDFIAELHGIALSYGRITGYNVYGRFERGARVIQLFEDEKKFATWIRQTDGEIVGKYTHNHESVMK